MTIWFTADHHFAHKNIIEYCGRPFSSAKSMNQAMISNWNGRVDADDTVYVLGDFTLGGGALAELYFSKLYGKILVVPGGHDYRWVEWAPHQDYRSKNGHKIEILPPLHTLAIPRPNQEYPLVIALCHYPMLSWDRSHYGSLHLHGHTHNTLATGGLSADVLLPPKSKGGRKGMRLDVGVDSHKFAPITLDQVMDWNKNEGTNNQATIT